MGHICNNPTQYVLQEAALLFPSQPVSCIVSLGTGAANVIGTVARDPFQKGLPHSLIGILKQIAVDCEGTSQTMMDRFRENENFYFRLNVNQGLQDVPLAEWEKINDVRLHTENYLERPDISPSVAQLVQALTARLEVEPSRLAFSENLILLMPCYYVDAHASTSAARPSQPTEESSIAPLLDGRDVMSDHMAISLNDTKNTDSTR